MLMSKITSVLFLLFSCISFSQTSKLIHGKVSYLDSYQKNVDIINFTSKKITQTNTLGEFTIEAKENDVLIFMSENFADQKYTITSEDFEKATVLIKLIEKPIPLEEVEIQQVRAIKIEKPTYEDARIAKIQKDQARPKNRDVYTGEIENGVDFIQIGRMIGKLFKSNKPKVEKQKPIPFKDYAAANFNESFFTKTLKVKPEDTARFLEYCEADPKSKSVMEKNDELAILEFLLAKKAEFDKL